MALKKIALLLVLTVSFMACGEKVKKEKDSNIFSFKEYVSFTSSGFVSVSEEIQIILAKEVEGWDPGAEISQKILKFSPRLDGELRVVNSKMLVFKPKNKMNEDTKYTFELQLNEIYPDVPSEYKIFTRTFRTIKQDFNVLTKNFQSISSEYQYIEGEVETADYAELEKIMLVVSAKHNSKKVKIDWSSSDSISKKFPFVLDSIQRFEDDTELALSWNGKAIGVANSGEDKLIIRGKNNFAILGVQAVHAPEQFLKINFSNALRKQQNFDGLVTISGGKNLTYAVEGNVLKVYPENRVVGNVEINVFEGIKSTEGFRLKETENRIVNFEQLKPAIQALSNGVILPNSKDLKFNFKAVNLKAVDVRIIKLYEDNILQFLQTQNLSKNDYYYGFNRVGRRVVKKTMRLVKNDLENNGKWKAYAIDLSKFIQADPGAIYRVELSMKPGYSLYECNSTVTNYEIRSQEDFDEMNPETHPSDEDETAYWDNEGRYYDDHYYYWRDRDDPCKDAYYKSRANKVSVNILGSNLGVIAKRGTDTNYQFAVTDILTTQPVSNAKVTLYNYQQQEIGTGVTNPLGITTIDLGKPAYFAIVTQGSSKTYLKLNDGNALSLSKFQVSGQKLQKGLKGFIYGERGVWRPGDTMHLNFVLNDKKNPLPKNHPISMELRDARGKVVDIKTTWNGINGFYTFKFQTSENDPTGNWNSIVQVGGVKFQKRLKVETVKPNRLKIKYEFNDKVLTSDKPISGKLSVNWLHGAPAKSVKTEVKAKFRKNSNPFKEDYPKYVFSDPTKDFSSKEIDLFSLKTNEQGFLNFNKEINLQESAPGMLHVSFLTKAFEKGGDFSIDVTSKKFAPYKSFVGIRGPEKDMYGSYETDKDIEFDVVVLNPKGIVQANKELKVEIHKIEWRWWWSSGSENLARYRGDRLRSIYKISKVKTNARGEVSIPINIPNRDGGRYLIRVIDEKDGHASGIVSYFYEDWWRNPSKDPESAKMLMFSSDKEQYDVGETAKITFPSSVNGRALISLETGSDVLESYWTETTEGETSIDIPITKEMAPNIYVHISLLQPHAATANDLPIRMYGVNSILVEDPATRLKPEIEMPDILRPEESFEIKVSEKNGKRMTYTLAIVEEGLLDLTRFKTPDIWNSFYTKEALGVKTWDIFDEVIGAYGGKLSQVFAIGGDGEAEGNENKKANRFKPVVRVLGPFTLNPGKETTHKMKLPKYIGSVRTMVVAGDNSKEAYGLAEKATPVKAPLMVLSTLPRKLSPGEEVVLPVTVFVMEEHVKNVSLSLKLSDGIKVVGDSKQRLKFDNPDEKMGYFKLDVSKGRGFETVEVIAKGNGEQASYKVEIDVVNPNPRSSKSMALEIPANSKDTLSFETFGIEGSNVTEIEFSTLPPMDITKRMNYLIQYPHGCVEQTTSSVFPQLYLSDIFELSEARKKEIQRNISEGIQRLNSFQTFSGGLSYWIGGTEPNEWGTSYAGHFIIEAEKKGYAVPIGFMSKWLAYQKSEARRWRPGATSRSSDLMQAYRLYTLALSGNPDLSSMNRMRESNNLSNNAQFRLAAAYALAGQHEVARKITFAANHNFSPGKNDYYSYGSRNRNKAMAMETMILIDYKKYLDFAKDLAKELSDDKWMSTQTTAYCLYAMSKMIEAQGGKDLNVSYELNKKGREIKTKYSLANQVYESQEGKNFLEVSNTSDNVLFVNVLNAGILPLGQEISESRGLNLKVEYRDLEGKLLDVSKLTQGTEFEAVVTIRNLKDQRVNDIALTEIFPSGWEIVNTRFTDYEASVESDANYTDIRDDRVNFYFDIDREKTKVFKVQLNAAYLGNYYLFGVQSEAMYDNDFFARSEGKWIEVVNE